MADQSDPNAVAETAVPRTTRPRETRRTSAFILPSSAEELTHVKGRWDDDSWQLKAIQFINSHLVQKILIGLLLTDVMIIFSELAIDAYFPACTLVIRDAISCCPAHNDASASASTEVDDNAHMMRMLSGGGGDDSHGQDHICASPLAATTYEAGCDGHKYPGVHTAHQALFWTTIAILSIFEFELLFLIYLLGPSKFFSQAAYVIDLFVVTCSMALELGLHLAAKVEVDVLPGILVLFRLWRFVRIGHGLVASTYEVQEHKKHMALDHIELLEERLEGHGEKLPERPEKLMHEEH